MNDHKPNVNVGLHHITADHVKVYPPLKDGGVAVLLGDASVQLHFDSVEELAQVATKILGECWRMAYEAQPTPINRAYVNVTIDGPGPRSVAS